MSVEKELYDLWFGIDDVSIELAQARDSYAALKGEEKKFQRLASAYSRLRDVEEALHNYIHKDRSRSRGAGDGLALVMSRAAVEYAKSLIEFANDDLAGT